MEGLKRSQRASRMRQSIMQTHDIIVVGCSAGGLQALTKIVKELPRDFDAAVFIASHISPHQRSVLPQLLSKAGMLKASHAVNGEEIKPGQIYVAPPAHHLLVEPRHIRLTRGPKENRFRPAIDPLFR